MTEYNLRYKFSANGQADVARAFQSIATAAAKSATAEQRASSRAEASASKAAAAKTQAAAKASHAVAKEVASASRAEQKHTAIVEREAKKRADVTIREAKRAAQMQVREQRQAQRMQERGAYRRSQTIGQVGGVVRDGLMMAGGAGLALVGASARKEFAVKSKARDIGISTRGSGQKMLDTDALVKEAHATARKNPGVDAESVLDGIKAYTTKTGDADTARKMSDTFATLSSASGTSTKDIGGAAADLAQKFGIKDPAEMQDALGKLYMQGKNGSFELSDAAEKFPGMAAAGARFGLDKGVKGVATLGGLSQIARESTGSADQAGTAVEAMFRQLTSRSGDLEKAGVKVFDKKGNANDIQDVLVDTISKVGGNDMAKKKVGLQQIFGDEGIRAISPLIDAFATAVKEGKDPMVALRSKLGNAINVTGAWSDVVEDATIAQQSDSAKMTAAWDALGAKVGESVLPELSKLADAFGKNDAALGALAGSAGILLQAFNSLAKVLGISPDAKNADQDVIDKTTALERFDDKVQGRAGKEGGPVALTKEEQAERARLEAELGGATSRRDALSAAAGGTLSKEDYKAEYERLGKKGNGPTETDRVFNAIKASATGVATGQGLVGVVNGIGGYNAAQETPEQRALRERQNGPTKTIAGVASTAVNAAADEGILGALRLVAPELSKAAADLTRAASALPRPNPLGG